MISLEVSSGLSDTGVRRSWTCTSIPRPEPILTQIAMIDRDRDHLSNDLEILSQLHSITLPFFLQGIWTCYPQWICLGKGRIQKFSETVWHWLNWNEFFGTKILLWPTSESRGYRYWYDKLRFLPCSILQCAG